MPPPLLAQVLPKSLEYFFTDENANDELSEAARATRLAQERDAFFNISKAKGRNGVSSKYLITLAHFTHGSNNHIIEALKPDVRLPEFLSESEVKETNFWITPPQRGHDTGLHYDDYDGVLAQLHGVKSVVLYSPWESEGLYPRVTNAVIKDEIGCDCAKAAASEDGGDGVCSALSMLLKCADFVHDTGVYVSGQLFKPVAFASQLQKPLHKLLPSAALLWWSLQAAGAPHAMYHYIKALQDHVGKNEMVWSCKKVGEKISWEIYFYGWPQVSGKSMPSTDSFKKVPRKSIAEITEINRRFFKGTRFQDATVPVTPDGTTMIIFSFDMHMDFFTGHVDEGGKSPEQANDAPMYRDGVHVYTVPVGTQLEDAVVGHGHSINLGDPAKNQGPQWKPEVEVRQAAAHPPPRTRRRAPATAHPADALDCALTSSPVTTRLSLQPASPSLTPPR